MTEHKKIRRHRRRENRDNSDMIIICLSDGPRTVADIEKQFIALPRRFGLFILPAPGLLKHAVARFKAHDQ